MNATERVLQEQTEADPTSRTVVTVTGRAGIITLAQVRKLVAEAEARGIPDNGRVTVTAKSGITVEPRITVAHDLEELAYRSAPPADYWILVDENWREIARVSDGDQIPSSDAAAVGLEHYLGLVWESFQGIVPAKFKQVRYAYRPGSPGAPYTLVEWRTDDKEGRNSITWVFEKLGRVTAWPSTRA